MTTQPQTRSPAELSHAHLRRQGLCSRFGVAIGLVAGATGGAVGEAVVCAIGDGEAAGLALPAGKTPAPESGAGEEIGEGET